MFRASTTINKIEAVGHTCVVAAINSRTTAPTVVQRLAALRFFFTQTIKKAWSVADTPYLKRARHRPSILSREEVAHLIGSALSLM